ncbi:phosphoglycerate dehydrogenase [Bdellovibrio bacteriovorus]|uniref:D-3-phosphoglycerate dehydrogenase n=1 Tax=Bdellovibrio bacteriovorus (strain ATCC 15356 / DSM 50701 / NCIMB 9529 / HD100) TaxID=264462 RepID=Q6MJ91_BDEBA|nr:phosphoglycerate dehydrogenase [Bdellovibrio bacteriovorus]CAE80670.1 D-3-phosphoglycerate dehydrogenase [Bdellovibrio bacteriovorus HD100]
MSAQRILLVENIHTVAKERLEEEGYKVDLITHAPSEDELLKILPNYDVLGIRSKTEVTKKVLDSNKHLVTIGCFCIGTNQVDLLTARERGIPVFNAPHSNTRSVAELVIAEMISLSRQLGDRNTQAHLGEWVKSAVGSKEVRGKTLGIVGYGHIGSQVSILAESMGLKVLFYDVLKKLPLGNAMVQNSLEDLLRSSDFVTLHVPETPETKDMIGARELSMMKKGSFLINASRGTVVVIDDLVKSLQEKHLAGCAIDVFPEEPASNKEKFKSPLQGIPNVILTPHIAGSTEEAQYAIGLEVAESFRRYLKIGSSPGAVNFPNVDLPVKQGTSRILNVHRNEPGVLGEINGLISKAGANIEGQYLSTDEKIGYLVMDLHSSQAHTLAADIEKLSRSIRTRVVY